MLAVALFLAALVSTFAVCGLSFIVAGVHDLLLGDIIGIFPVLFGVILLLGAASLALIFFVPA